MIKVSQPGRAAPATDDLKGRIVSFMGGASTEITPSEESRLPELKSVLPAGAAVFVAHTPNAGFSQVIHAALAVRSAGFLATPHIAVRRVPNPQTLRAGLTDLVAGGVEDILLIAGDAPRPMGEFSGTLDILASRILQESGISRVAIAGHPEGHSAVASASLWEALEAKQAFAERTGVSMHIVTQFALARLLHFAIQCGIGASMRAMMRNLSAATHPSDLATSPDQHLLRLLSSPVSAQIAAPHFFAFGGALETAHWMQKVAAGAFDIDAKAGRFVIWD